jgi:hypothetical protein
MVYERDWRARTLWGKCVVRAGCVTCLCGDALRELLYGGRRVQGTRLGGESSCCVYEVRAGILEMGMHGFVYHETCVGLVERWILRYHRHGADCTGT